jgi:hypothetical protein
MGMHPAWHKPAAKIETRATSDLTESAATVGNPFHVVKGI